MSAKSILEADGKAILNYHLTRAPVIKPSPLAPSKQHNAPPRLASLHFPEDAKVEDVLNQAEITYPWLLQEGAKFVAKPDQLIKRRGKSGLLALNKTWPEAKAWVAERATKTVPVEHVEGVLRQFLVEPFVPHPDGTEYYININSVRDVSSLSFVCLCRRNPPFQPRFDDKRICGATASAGVSTICMRMKEVDGSCRASARSTVMELNK